MPWNMPGLHGRIEGSPCGAGRRGLPAKEQHAPRLRAKRKHGPSMGLKEVLYG